MATEHRLRDHELRVFFSCSAELHQGLRDGNIRLIRQAITELEMLGWDTKRPVIRRSIEKLLDYETPNYFDDEACDCEAEEA